MKVEIIPVGRLMANCYVVYHEDTREAAIIDPGDEADTISSFIEENNLTPKAILLTHSHFDHVLAAEELREKYNVPIAVHEKEKKLLENEEKRGSLPYHKTPICIKADVFLKDGEKYSPISAAPFLTIHTPGHTEGGASYYMKELNAIFTGDTLFRMSVGRSDFFTGNHGQLIKSIKDKLLTFDPETIIYPGHEDASTIGYENRYNTFLKG